MSDEDRESHLRLMFAEAMGFAREAIRGAMLINGGAAAGLLAFMPSARDAGANVPLLASALLYFGAGAFAAALCASLSYLAQIVVAERAKAGKVGDGWKFQALRLAAIFSCAGSLLFFIYGLWIAKQAIAP